MKKLLNLEGAKLLSKTQQKAINGGVPLCKPDGSCGPGYCVVHAPKCLCYPLGSPACGY